MRERGLIVRVSEDEMRPMQARGESRTDWTRAGAMTEAEIDASMAADPDEAGMIFDWSQAIVTLPQP